MPKACNPFDYQVKAVGTDEAELFIYGDIGDSLFGESVTARDIVNQLHDMVASTVYVRINSFGGAVADALAIHNALRRKEASIVVTVDGLAVSAASLIAMAGDTIQMADNGLMMIHAPSGIAMGNAKDMQRMADVLDKFSAAMSAAYVRKTGKSADDILDLLTDGEDHWFTAPEAVEEGFADDTTDAADQTANAGDVSRFLGQAPATIAAALRPHFRNSRKESPMTVKSKGADGAPTQRTGADNIVDINAARDEARRETMVALKERNRDIKARFAGVMDRDGVREIVDVALQDPEIDVDAISKAVLAKLGEEAAPINKGNGVTAGADETDKRRDAMAQSLLARMGQGQIEGANPFRGRRMNELARAALEAGGTETRDMANVDICAMALGAPNIRAAGGQTSSDFPVLLENVMHKLVLEGFDAQPATWDQVAATGDVSDFREWNRLVPGLLGSLDTVNERGEYPNKNLPDAQKNTNQAKRHGNIIDITPEVLVNDDTGYIQRMATGLGRVGARTIEQKVYELLEGNPTLSDGVALFHADHSNLSTAAKPSADAVDDMRVAMANQTAPGEDGVFLGIRPAIALSGVALEGDIRVIVQSPFDPDSQNKLQRPNKVYNLVQNIVSAPQLSKQPWYLFADPMVAPVLEVVFLDGQRAPRIVVDEAFRTGGIRYRVELAFGVGAIDYRGAQKNPGIA